MGLVLSVRGDGECGLNARRDETRCARRLDHGYRRPRLWRGNGASRRRRKKTDCIAGGQRRFSAARHLRVDRRFPGTRAAESIGARREDARGEHGNHRQGEDRGPQAARRASIDSTAHPFAGSGAKCICRTVEPEVRRRTRPCDVEHINLTLQVLFRPCDFCHSGG